MKALQSAYALCLELRRGDEFPAGLDPNHATTLGLTLVIALIGQLKSRLQVDPGPLGASFEIHLQGIVGKAAPP